MSRTPNLLLFAMAALLGTAATFTQAPPSTGEPAGQPTSKQQSEVVVEITSPAGPPKYAVPDFLSLSNDPQTKEAAKTIGQVLWDDLAFEREFYMIPRDTYSTIPAARSVTDVPLD